MSVINQYPLLGNTLMKLFGKRISQKALDHFNLSAEKADRRLAMETGQPDFISAILRNGLSEKGDQNQENKWTMSRAEIHSNSWLYVTIICIDHCPARS
jgi:hypothetical protein